MLERAVSPRLFRILLLARTPPPHRSAPVPPEQFTVDDDTHRLPPPSMNAERVALEHVVHERLGGQSRLGGAGEIDSSGLGAFDTMLPLTTKFCQPAMKYYAIPVTPTWLIRLLRMTAVVARADPSHARHA